MTINWLHLLVLVLQCLVQSWFLSLYFDAGRRGFLIYAGFFLFILYPLDAICRLDWALLKNILNCIALLLLFRVMNPELSLKQRLLGFVLYWLPLPLCEIPVHILIHLLNMQFIFSQDIYVLFGQTHWLLGLAQLLATWIMALIYGLILKKVRSSSPSQTLFLYLTSLLASLSILAFYCISLSYPRGYAATWQQYVLMTVMLAAFDVWFAVSLHRYMQRQTDIRAGQIIRQEYRKQLQALLKPDLSRQELRRFRHDLINALEHERLTQNSRSADDLP